MSCQQLPCWHATVTNKVGMSAVDGPLLSTSTCTPVPRGQQDLDAIKFTNDHQKKTINTYYSSYYAKKWQLSAMVLSFCLSVRLSVCRLNCVIVGHWSDWPSSTIVLAAVSGLSPVLDILMVAGAYCVGHSGCTNLIYGGLGKAVNGFNK